MMYKTYKAKKEGREKWKFFWIIKKKR
jgi:hypothetical protein